MIMATRKRTKKYYLSDLVENFKLVDLSEEEPKDDNGSDRESYFSDSEFKNDANTVVHLQSTATANTSHDSVQSAGNTSDISTTDATRNESMLELFSSNDDSDTASASNFADHNWKSVEPTYTSPSDINFSKSSGISNSVTLNKESLQVQFFLLFVTEHIIKIMVTKRNRYAEQIIAHSVVTAKSRMKRWVATTNTEMKRFLGILFTMGLVKKACTESYWSTDPVIATPTFNSTMPRDRFELLLRFWQFSDNESAVDGDRLSKLRKICNALLERFQALYIPGKEISIDESMVFSRGRLIFRQYIPGKRHKYDVKLYMLCEHAGYVWNDLVYCAKMNPLSGFGHAETVVLKLMEKLLDRGHALYVDNFYTSVPLAKALLNRKTLICGTLRKNRKQLP